MQTLATRARRPPAICLVASRYPPGIGGVAVSAHRLARCLVDAGCRLHVVATYPLVDRPPREERADEDGATVHRLFFDPAQSNAQFFFRSFVRGLDAEVGFDLFHGFFLTSVPPCVRAARSSSGPPRPVIASIRGSDAAWLIQQPLLRRLIFDALRHAAWLTSVNQLYLDQVAPLVGLAGRCSVIRGGVAPVAGPAWQLNGGNEGVVGTTGDFRPVKDIPLLIRGYAAAPAALRRRLLLAGAFSHRQEEEWSQTLVDELGIRGELEITGRYQHVQVGALLRRMHVYVLSSAWEGMPNGLIEAAARGVPIVATAVDGVSEIIADGTHGLLVPHGAPEDLGGAIARVLRDADLAGRLSAGARRLAESLSESRERAAWLDLYDSLLNERRPAETAH